MIYAYAGLEGAERLMALGMEDRARRELERTVAMVPALAEKAAAIREKEAVP
jgi:flagellar biosynthesis regulator FlaF